MAATTTSEITDLYRAHERGELGPEDRRWLSVQALVHAIAEERVRANSRGLFGTPLEQRVEDVAADLLRKFIQRKFKTDRPSIEALVETSARNALMSSFRASRSPATVYGDPMSEESWEAPENPEPEIDQFETIRRAMGSFRFPEDGFVREAMLAYLLTHQSYPGPQFVRSFGVRRATEHAVYTAAVVDINTALWGLEPTK